MNRIKELRKAKKITVIELSEALEIPQSTLTNYENGKRTPRDQETWQKLADYFEVPVSYLMGVTNKMISDEKALSVAKEVYYYLLNNPEKIDEREAKALKYFEDKNLDELLKEIMLRYFSNAIVLSNEKYSNLKDLTWLEGDMAYQLWEKYRMVHKTNQNLIDKIYYSLPIDEEVTLYKHFDTFRKTITTDSNRIELITYLIEEGINAQLEKELVKILEETSDKINDLRNKYPDEESDIKQVTQALVYDDANDKHAYKFWKRIDGNEIEDETNLTEEEKNNLIKVASKMIQDQSKDN